MKEGYEFEGWFAEKDGEEEITSQYIPEANVVLYARWKEILNPPAPTVEVTVEETEKTLKVGETYSIQAMVTPEDTLLTFISSDAGVAAVDENGKVTAVAEGTATITVAGSENPESAVTVKITVTKKADSSITNPETKVPAVGTVFQSGILQYKITKSDAKNGTVEVNKLLKQKSKVTIPATVKKDGYVFKVTSVKKQVFQKNKKLKSVILGKNLTGIGAKSFFKCPKLKAITFKGMKAPKIGSRAFTGIKKNCKITVPKKMSKKNLKKLKKSMKSAGKNIRYRKK